MQINESASLSLSAVNAPVKTCLCISGAQKGNKFFPCLAFVNALVKYKCLDFDRQLIRCIICESQIAIGNYAPSRSRRSIFGSSSSRPKHGETWSKSKINGREEAIGGAHFARSHVFARKEENRYSLFHRHIVKKTFVIRLATSLLRRICLSLRSSEFRIHSICRCKLC